MGFQTNISILNDHFDWIAKNPRKFVEAISESLHDGTDSFVSRVKTVPRHRQSDSQLDASHHYVTVHRSRHADNPQVIFTHRNMAIDVIDLTHGIEDGFLESVDPSERAFYTQKGHEIAKELRRIAKQLEAAIKDHSNKEEVSE